jgi:hypothetical protein
MAKINVLEAFVLISAAFDKIAPSSRFSARSNFPVRGNAMADVRFEQAGLRQPARLRQEARVIGVLFASTTSIIGSGWLFGSFRAARIAGPLAV